jgi:TfoX/Sxy family transcriptional regulator of competence genes
MEGYYQVPPSVLEDRDALAEWARQAIEVSRAAATRRRRR